MREIFIAVWKYRDFVVSSIVNEFKTRFIRSKFGLIWMILHPLAQVLVYALILSNILRAKLPGVTSQYAYPIYLMAGMVAWVLFQEILSRFLVVFIDNGELLKKVAFPKLTLPLIVIGVATVNALLLLVSMFLIFAILGHMPIHALVWLPFLLILTIMLAAGLGLTLGVLNIFLRDVGQVMEIVLQFWFWLTPVVYTMTIIPEHLRFWLYLNPLTALVEGYQAVLLYDRPPLLIHLLYPAIVAMGSLIFGFILFRKAREEMADVL